MAADAEVAPGHGAPLTVAAVARRLGVAPPTLRTWDRRYGLGPSGHEAGSHRRYTPEDVARLLVMRRLVLDGVAAADAARIALDADVGGAAAEQPTQAAPNVVPLRRREDRLGTLTAAATALDAATLTRWLRDQLDRRGVVPTWDDLIAPLLLWVGDRWASTGRGVDVEHLVSEAVLDVLRAHAHRALPVPPPGSRHVLLACADDEQHSLPLYAVAAALAERGLSARVLGARVPREALAAAVRRTGPSAVFLWSQSPRTGDPDAVSEVPAVRPAPVVVLGGPGWREPRPHDLPVTVQRVGTLVDAVAVLARTVTA